MIYVLGGEGFVGSALVRHCRARGIPHAVVECHNYADYLGSACDVLINANGNSKKHLAREQPLAEFDQTVRSVRASLVDFRAAYYVHLSTCDVYPDCSSPETTQENRAPDPGRQSAYGFHKWLAEQCVRHAAPQWLIVRLGGMVGPGMRKNPIFDILHQQPLWLDPASRLQFLHTDTVAEIIFSLIQRKLAAEAVNLCGRGLISLQEVMDLAGKTTSVQPGSPKVCYDVSIEKLSAICPVPETRETVRAFIRDWQGT